MRKFFFVIALMVACMGALQAQSAKATAKVGEINVLDSVKSPESPRVGVWRPVLKNQLKTPNQKDLFIGVSMECGLLTDTTVKSKLGVSDTSMADAAIEVRVLIDGNEALPGTVVFGRRTQTLTATFQGLIAGCMTVDPLTGGVIIDEACVEPEELQLILKTMNANTFNFIIQDLKSGMHQVEVQARINLAASAQAGAANAMGLIGKGSMVVEEVRLVKSPLIEL